MYSSSDTNNHKEKMCNFATMTLTFLLNLLWHQELIALNGGGIVAADDPHCVLELVGNFNWGREEEKKLLGRWRAVFSPLFWAQRHFALASCVSIRHRWRGTKGVWLNSLCNMKKEHCVFKHMPTESSVPEVNWQFGTKNGGNDNFVHNSLSRSL